MSASLSRQKIARYVADEMVAGRTKAVTQELAAYLLETGRTDEAEAIVRTVHEQLETDGRVYARVTSASPLTAPQKAAVKSLLQADTVELDETVDASVIGGIRLETPSRVLDATIARRLHTLRESKA